MLGREHQSSARERTSTESYPTPASTLVDIPSRNNPFLKRRREILIKGLVRKVRHASKRFHSLLHIKVQEKADKTLRPLVVVKKDLFHILGSNSRIRTIFRKLKSVEKLSLVFTLYQAQSRLAILWKDCRSTHSTFNPVGNLLGNLRDNSTVKGVSISNVRKKSLIQRTSFSRNSSTKPSIPNDSNDIAGKNAQALWNVGENDECD